LGGGVLYELGYDDGAAKLCACAGGKDGRGWAWPLGYGYEAVARGGASTGGVSLLYAVGMCGGKIEEDC